MGWFGKLMNIVFRRQLSGLRLDEQDAVARRLPRNPARFFRALPALCQGDAILYCEGTTDAKVRRWLKRHALEPPSAKVAVGTLFPAPDYYHVPLQPDLMHELAAIVDAEAVALPCLHVHVYREGRVLLEWHDAFLDDPVLLSRALSVERVASFASATGADQLVA